MPTVVIHRPDGTREERVFGAELILGRGEESHLKLTEGGVSRRHARLFVGEDGATWVEDLGSSNGTFVDGERIEGPTSLSEHSRVVVGEYELALKAGGRARPPSRSGGSALARVEGGASRLAKRPEPAPMSFVLVGVTGPWAGQTFSVEGKMLVGRTEPANILLDDGSVSRRHAEVELRPDTVVVRDLGSANGTRINEQPVHGDSQLFPGDTVRFGVVEFALEERTDDGGQLAPIVDKLGAPIPSRRRRAKAATGAMSGGKLVGILLGVMVVVGGLAALLWKLVAPSGGEVQEVGPSTAVKQSPLEAALAECRTYAATDGDVQPNWQRAEAACNKALDLEPLNRSGLELLKRIKMEKAAALHFAAGEKDLLLLKEEVALEEFGKIPPESVYYFKAKPRVLEAATAVKRRAGEDCRRYMVDGLAKTALPRCEAYMDYACQNMTPEELRPPVNFRINLGSGKLRRREWRPRDPLYVLFLRARTEVEPRAAPWECKKMGIAETGPHVESPEAIVRKALEEKFSEKAFGLALYSYWAGHSSDAIASLQRFLRDNRKAAFHRDAEELKRQMTIGYNLFQRGEGDVQRGNPERAAESLEEQLKIDEQLIGMPLAKDYPSFYRRNIQQDMGRAAYLAGKDKMDRQDSQPACRLWKLGFRFTKQDTDLLRAIEHCSELARSAVGAASSCGQLKAAEELAVEGDGVRQKAAEREAELHCTGG